MDRTRKLRRVVPGLPDETLAALAARPVADVDMLVQVARQARQDERKHQADLRRQRKADARKHGHYDAAELGGRNLRMLDATARRVEVGDLDALAWLGETIRHADALVGIAVDGLRARGFSDALIGDALGITRQAVWNRFGRKPGFAEPA